MSFFNALRSIGSDKLFPIPLTKSSSSGNFTTTSNTYVDVTNLSIPLTTTVAGRPIELYLEAMPGTQGGAGASATGGNRIYAWVCFSRVTVGVPGTVIISECFFGMNADTALSLIDLPASAFRAYDETPVGVHTFKVQIKIVTGTVGVYTSRLVLRQT